MVYNILCPFDGPNEVEWYNVLSRSIINSRSPHKNDQFTFSFESVQMHGPKNQFNQQLLFSLTIFDPLLSSSKKKKRVMSSFTWVQLIFFRFMCLNRFKPKCELTIVGKSLTIYNWSAQYIIRWIIRRIYPHLIHQIDIKYWISFSCQ